MFLYHLNKTSWLSRPVRLGGLEEGTPVDLVLSCVDNFEARMAINKVGTCGHFLSHCVLSLFQL